MNNDYWEQDQDERCEVCGKLDYHCECVECPECGDIGNLECYTAGHMKISGVFPNGINTVLLEKVFVDYDSLYCLYRSIYKYTACGPTLGVRMYRGDGGYSTIYNSDLPNKWGNEIVTHFYVSSIIDGCDYDTETIEIEIGDISTLESRLFAAVTEVNRQAHDIWKETHGCETCERHWTSEGIDLSFKYTPVWNDCPECNGDGIII